MKLQTDTPMLHLRNLLVSRGFDVEPANYSLEVSERVLNEYPNIYGVVYKKT